ncbi:hypothetical protein LCGC14_1648640 [marine sediment metagenome]|uniref:Response regulatory domain-containing protein n=1 Tax=marine sediment metagenome TaxID=412755 RepID=A0A0F9KDD5_9ZZZZ
MIKVCLVGSDVDKEFALLQTQYNITVAKMAEKSFDDLLLQIVSENPDVLVISDAMSSLSADDLCLYVSLQIPSAKTVIITDKPASYERLELSGFACRGFITYEQRHAIVRAVKVVHDGESWIPRKLVSDVLDRLASQTKHTQNSLV